MKQEIKERIERIRKGEVPEGYKRTKVGIIPDDWNVFNIDEISEVKSGKRLPKGRMLLDSETPHPYIRVTDMHKGGVSLNDIKYVPIDVYPAIKKYRIFKRDIFISVAGTLGVVGIIPEILDGANLTENADKLTNISCNRDFLLFVLMSPLIQSVIESESTLGAQPKIALTRIRKFKIPLPKEQNEQEKIAEIISTWDKAIDLKEKIIEDRKKLRIAIVNDLLFGLKRFDEFIKSHNYNQTKYTNIPEDWDFIEIGEIATEVSEKNGSNDDLPVLSCTKYAGLVDSLSYFKRQVFSKDTSTYKQVKKNQFVYATNHIDEGSIGCQNLYENSLVSPMYTVFKTNSKVNNDFLFSLLKTRFYIFIYQVNMSASVDRRGSLRWNEFSKIRIPLPNIAEQNKIVEFIRLVDNEIDLLNKELNQLKEQKKGLMQLLLTGIVRVEMN